VCVLQDNGLDILLVFLALLKIGAIPAFINTNLTGDSLLHCITIVDSVAVVFDGKFAPALSQIKQNMDSKLLYISARPLPDDNRVSLPSFVNHQITQEGIFVSVYYFKSSINLVPLALTLQSVKIPDAWTQCATSSLVERLVYPSQQKSRTPKVSDF
jgi:acyl-CoA synthetase (AMP-forming)/AMP-acid ligase II